METWGWSALVKMSCILCHRGIQLMLAYSWASPTILAACKGKGRRGMFLFLLFLHFHSFSFLPWPSLSSPLLSLLYLFSLSLGDDTKGPTRVDMSLNRNSIDQIGVSYLPFQNCLYAQIFSLSKVGFMYFVCQKSK